MTFVKKNRQKKTKNVDAQHVREEKREKNMLKISNCYVYLKWTEENIYAACNNVKVTHASILCVESILFFYFFLFSSLSAHHTPPPHACSFTVAFFSLHSMPGTLQGTFFFFLCLFSLSRYNHIMCKTLSLEETFFFAFTLMIQLTRQPITFFLSRLA